MQAAERFAADEDTAAVAKALRAHVRSVQRWRAAWEIGGEAALVSKGPPNHPQLSQAQFALLEAELERGPVAHGWPDLADGQDRQSREHDPRAGTAESPPDEVLGRPTQSGQQRLDSIDEGKRAGEPSVRRNPDQRVTSCVRGIMAREAAIAITEARITRRERTSWGARLPGSAPTR